MKEHEGSVIADAELVELFRRRRPDAAEFRAGVARRVREKERAEQEGGDAVRKSAPVDEAGRRVIWRAEFVRRAAAFVPIDPVGGSLGLAGAAKLVSSTLALPLLLLVASVGAFVASLRSTLRSTRSAMPARKEPDPWSDAAKTKNHKLGLAPWTLNLFQLVGGVLFLAPVVTDARWLTDAVLVLFVLAALTLVILVRGLAETALLTPRTVSRYACTILVGLMIGVFMHTRDMSALDRDSDLGLGWSAAVVLGGLVVCPLIVKRGPGWMGVACAIYALLFTAFANPLRLTHSSPWSIESQLAAVELDAAHGERWKQAATLYEALVAAGEKAPPPVSAASALDVALASDVEIGANVWTAAVHMGLMTPDRWARLATHRLQPYRLNQLLAVSGPLHLQSYDEYQFPLILATRALTAAQRDWLVERVDASWPARDAKFPLRESATCVRLYDALGRSDRVDAHREEVHAILRTSWISERGESGHEQLGGFDEMSGPFRSSREEPTLDAVTLMGRLGVPDGIDLRAVRGYLRSVSGSGPFDFGRAWYKTSQRAALLRLEREVGIPPRSWIATLVAERIFIAAVLLVILCIVAIRSAPDVDAAVRRGAMP